MWSFTPIDSWRANTGYLRVARAIAVSQKNLLSVYSHPTSTVLKRLSGLVGAGSRVFYLPTGAPVRIGTSLVKLLLKESALSYDPSLTGTLWSQGPLFVTLRVRKASWRMSTFDLDSEELLRRFLLSNVSSKRYEARFRKSATKGYHCKMWCAENLLEPWRMRFDDGYRFWLDRIGARCNIEVLFLRKTEREGRVLSGVLPSSKYPDTGESGSAYDAEMDARVPLGHENCYICGSRVSDLLSSPPSSQQVRPVGKAV